MNFTEAIALHKEISALNFRCSEDCPKLSVIDNQTYGYAIALKKNPNKKCCQGCCVKELLESRNLQVTEDEKYLIFR